MNNEEVKALKYPIILDLQHCLIERENTTIKDYLEEGFEDLYCESDPQLFGYIDGDKVVEAYKTQYIQINSYEEFIEKYNIEDFEEE